LITHFVQAEDVLSSWSLQWSIRIFSVRWKSELWRIWCLHGSPYCIQYL